MLQLIVLVILAASAAFAQIPVAGPSLSGGGGGGGGGAVSSVTAGPLDALVVSPTTGGVIADANDAYICNKTGACSITGPWTFAGATSTAPIKVATSDPATCTVGDFLFRSDTGTTKACTATNTWTGVGGGGGTIRTTYAALPTCNSSTANYQYILTDSIYSANCNGTSYAYWTGQKYIPTLPWSTGTTFGTGATITTAGGAVLFDGGANTGGDSIRSIINPIPAAPYTIIIDIDVSLSTTVSSSCGILITDGTTAASNKVITLMQGSAGVNMTKLSNSTTWNSNYIVYNQSTSQGKISFKLVDDGTNRTWSKSTNRILWKELSQQGRTDFLTATHYGYGCNLNGVSGDSTMVVEGVYAQ